MSENQRIPIDAAPGTVVIYHGTCEEQVKWGCCTDPRPLLKLHNRYTVDHTEIHSWHTKILLREVARAFPIDAFHLANVEKVDDQKSVMECPQ